LSISAHHPEWKVLECGLKNQWNKKPGKSLPDEDKQAHTGGEDQ
jgi:hypothetical protein